MQLPDSLDLHVQGHLSASDAARQMRTARSILARFEHQPGVVLGDEVGMGKTFVALAVASAHVVRDPARPVVVMVPRAVVAKWQRDADTFRLACLHDGEERGRFRVRAAETGIDFLKLLDDPEDRRATVIILAHGALHRQLADKWVKLAVLQASVRGRPQADALRVRLARFAPMILRLGRKPDERYELFHRLLALPPGRWKAPLVEHGLLSDSDDDPVPDVLLNALRLVDLSEVFERAVNVIPERKSAHLPQRIADARRVLDRSDGGVLPRIWRAALKRMELVLPLLVLDEAHRVRHAGTQLASLLSATRDDLDAVGGQLSERFERMLFLTATPFQLGHAELRNVLNRFDAINWRSANAPTMTREGFRKAIDDLHSGLDAMQLATDRLERAWKRLRPSDVTDAEKEHGAAWWQGPQSSPAPDCLAVENDRVRSVMLALRAASTAIRDAETRLRPWVIRNSRSLNLPAPFGAIRRRVRIEGAQVLAEVQGSSGSGPSSDSGGLKVGSAEAIPFLLSARIATRGSTVKVFAEGIASSFEALLDTRKDDVVAPEVPEAVPGALGQQRDWHIDHLRAAVQGLGPKTARLHPKMRATVDLAMHLWRLGEKVLVFCHYVQTAKALRRHLSEAMQEAIDLQAMEFLRCPRTQVAAELGRVAMRFDRDRPAARRVTTAVDTMIDRFAELRDSSTREAVQDIVLRFLRTPSFLVRFADLQADLSPEDWVESLLVREDASGLRLVDVITQFLEFLSKRRSADDRWAYLDALRKLQTGTHVGADTPDAFDGEDVEDGERMRLAANVRLVFGATRQEARERLMLTFNTPFYPEILIASSVMAEGVDLHMNCRHVIHHDLDWNPSSLEQRTGRIDRLGAKAERCGHSIRVYLPYIEGCQDEKLFRVVMDRERWFGVVMGAEESMTRVLKASAWEVERMAEQVLVPQSMVAALGLHLEDGTSGDPS